MGYGTRLQNVRTLTGVVHLRAGGLEFNSTVRCHFLSCNYLGTLRDGGLLCPAAKHMHAFTLLFLQSRQRNNKS